MTSILLIEDDAMTRKFLRVQLETAGYTVDEAADGAMGIAQFCARLPDLVLVDIFMPGLDGLEVIQAVRERAPSLPVVAMSAGGAMGARDTLYLAKEMGADVVLVKPTAIVNILEVMRRLLDARSQTLL
jgi:DNA-binding response OmpR family regulator